MKSFASDNYSGVAPEIMQALISANHEHQPAYGNDPYTQEAQEIFKTIFGENSQTYFAYNGTAANSVGLKAVLKSHQAILCPSTAHIANQEVGAATYLTGCPTFGIESIQGKISAESLQKTYEKTSYWGHHGNQPKVVSISQSTELGTVYTLEELQAISKVCQKNNLIFHMDGCRLSNAAVYLNKSLKEITQEAGVDVLTFGGTKNGLMLGDAMVFLKPELAEEFAYVHKQNLQLNSKMRFISAQFIPYLKNNLWHRYASHANQMCQLLTQKLLALNIEGVRLAYPQETNQLFIYLPEKIIKQTQEIYPYYLWDKSQNLARLVTSFDTTKEDIEGFLRLVKNH